MENLKIIDGILVECLNKELTSVTIPDGVTSIGHRAFRDCKGLKSVIIPNGVTSIGDFAFYHCTDLTNISIPDGVTSIGVCAFDGCSSLTSITIPDSVASIGLDAFRGCNNLKSQAKNYKAFDLMSGCLQCRSVLFTPMKWSHQINNIRLCQRGYHYCTNLFDIFNYYSGEMDKYIAIYECDVGDVD